MCNTKLLPKFYNAKEIESRWYNLWQKNKLFTPKSSDSLPKKNPLKKPYVIMMPPPKTHIPLDQNQLSINCFNSTRNHNSRRACPKSKRFQVPFAAQSGSAAATTHHVAARPHNMKINENQ